LKGTFKDMLEMLQLIFRAFIKHKILGYPLFIVIEPINICNLSCPACSAPQKYISRERRAMSFEEFKIIVDKIKKYTCSIELFFCGEPLLNKDLFKMISYARQNKLRVTVSTNGTLLHLYTKEIVNSGLNRLHVSFHGPTKDSLEKFMVGAKFEEIIKGVSLLVKTKRELGKRWPIIELGMVVTRYNEDKIEMFINLAKKLGVKPVLKKFVLAENIYPEEEIMKNLHFVPTDPKWSKYIIDGRKFYVKRTREKCDWWKSCIILVDGKVCACCYDIDGRYCYGNIFKSDFQRLWKSPISKKMRALIKNRGLPLCLKCPD
jgi:MoaA/NifB/PqqE/SkfB family radical SAM enzyme